MPSTLTAEMALSARDGHLGMVFHRWLISRPSDEPFKFRKSTFSVHPQTTSLSGQTHSPAPKTLVQSENANLATYKGDQSATIPCPGVSVDTLTEILTQNDFKHKRN